MPKRTAIHLPDDPMARIVTVRGQRLILDVDLAAIYGVKTGRLNEQVKRNADRFPPDFMFRLTQEEFAALAPHVTAASVQPVDNKNDNACRSRLTATETTSDMRSQNATASKRNARFLPFAFTEHGAIMAATVLNSPRAVQMSVFVVRAFIRMRAALANTQELAQKLAALEKEIKTRLDIHESAIVDTLRRLMDIIDPPALPEPPTKEIGFRVREGRPAYGVKPNKRRLTKR